MSNHCQSIWLHSYSSWFVCEKPLWRRTGPELKGNNVLFSPLCLDQMNELNYTCESDPKAYIILWKVKRIRVCGPILGISPHVLESFGIWWMSGVKYRQYNSLLMYIGFHVFCSDSLTPHFTYCSHTVERYSQLDSHCSHTYRPRILFSS